MSDRAIEEWQALSTEYRALIADGSESSSFLRDIGLKPTVLRLLGDCSSENVLDVGTGSGWLFDALAVREAHACNIVRPERLPQRIDFRIADASSLPWS